MMSLNSLAAGALARADRVGATLALHSPRSQYFLKIRFPAAL